MATRVGKLSFVPVICCMSVVRLMKRVMGCTVTFGKVISCYDVVLWRGKIDRLFRSKLLFLLLTFRHDVGAMKGSVLIY